MRGRKDKGKERGRMEGKGIKASRYTPECTMVDLQTQPLHIPADRPPVEYQIAG